MKKGYWISLYTKIDNQENLEKYDTKKLPTYIYKNLDKFKEWIN